MLNLLHITIGEKSVGKKKTSVSIDEELWNEFCSIVVKKYGNRKNSEILEDMIKNYIKKNKNGAH